MTKIKALEKYLTHIVGEHKGYVYGHKLTLEYQGKNTYDEYSFLLGYNFKDKEYYCDGSIYYSSEDNNAENPDAHTEDFEFENKDLKVLLKDLKEEFGENFVKLFYEDMKITMKYGE